MTDMQKDSSTGVAVSNEKHLKIIRRLYCCVCGQKGPDPHHLRGLEMGRGMGKTAGDNWVVPLCRYHHMKVHLVGTKKEESWFENMGIDRKALALTLWSATGDEEEMRKRLLSFMW